MQPLILLGASVRAAAFSALRAGFAPRAIDLFADRDLADVCPAVKIQRYPGEFLSLLAAAPGAPWMYSGGLENYPRLVDRLAAIRPLWGNRGEVLRMVRDPQAWANAAMDAGCLAPKPGGAAALASIGVNAWLVKPRRSGGGLGIHFASPNEIIRPPRGTYLQEYVTGESASAVFVAAEGCATLLGTTRQLLGRDFGTDRPFLYVGSVSPLPLGETERSQICSLGNLLAERFRLVGLFNIDFIRTAAGPCAIEVNPRYSASIEVIERITDVDLVGLHATACETGSLPNEPIAGGQRFAGKAVVYARRSGIVPPSFDRLVSEWNQAGQPLGLADLPRIGETLHAGQPVVTVLVDGTSLDDVEQELRHRISAVEQLLANEPVVASH
jgi:uncharacterized protein